MWKHVNVASRPFTSPSGRPSGKMRSQQSESERERCNNKDSRISLRCCLPWNSLRSSTEVISSSGLLRVYSRCSKWSEGTERTDWRGSRNKARLLSQLIDGSRCKWWSIASTSRSSNAFRRGEMKSSSLRHSRSKQSCISSRRLSVTKRIQCSFGGPESSKQRNIGEEWTEQQA